MQEKFIRKFYSKNTCIYKQKDKEPYENYNNLISKQYKFTLNI